MQLFSYKLNVSFYKNKYEVKFNHMEPINLNDNIVKFKLMFDEARILFIVKK